MNAIRQTINAQESQYYLKLGLTSQWGQTPDPEKVQFLERYTVGNEILDVGCATGLYAAYLARQGKRVVGLDYVFGLLPNVSQGVAGYVNGSALALPFADKQFDTVIIFDVLEHLNDYLALRELKRIARQRIIARVPLSEPAILENTGLIFYHHEDKTRLRTYSVEGIRTLLAETDLREVVIQPVCPVNVVLLFLRHIRFPIFRGVVGMSRRMLRCLGAVELYTDCFIIADVR